MVLPGRLDTKGQGFLASLRSHTDQIDREITEKTPSKRNHGHWIAGVAVETTTPNGDPWPIPSAFLVGPPVLPRPLHMPRKREDYETVESEYFAWRR